jgi:hypothetical protein
LCELRSGVSTSAATDCIKNALTVQVKRSTQSTVSMTKSGMRKENLPGETSVRRKSVGLCRREGITRGGLEEDKGMSLL